MSQGTGPEFGTDQKPSEIAYDALTGHTTPADTQTGAHAAAPSSTGYEVSDGGRTGGRAEQAAAVKDQAQQRAGEVAGTAKEQAANVAGTAKEQAANVAGTAKEQAGNVLGEAKNQAADLFGDLRRQLSEQSDGVRDRLAEFLTGAGSELSDMAGAGGGSGYATQVVRQVGDRASSWGSHLTNHDAADLLEQSRTFARRKPGTFLLGAVLAGVVAGRLTRGAKSHHDAVTATDTSSVTVPHVQATPVTVPTSSPYSETDAIVTRTRPTTPLVDEGAPFVTPDIRP
jgi:uncharacterized protein YjbJ (UPF0337 family)